METVQLRDFSIDNRLNVPICEEDFMIHIPVKKSSHYRDMDDESGFRINTDTTWKVSSRLKEYSFDNYPPKPAGYDSKDRPKPDDHLM